MTVVLITGALTGIGRATALAFAREGDQIVVSGRHGEAGEELAKELRAQGAEAEFVCADARYDEGMRNLVDQTVKRFGRLDVVELEVEDWEALGKLRDSMKWTLRHKKSRSLPRPLRLCPS
jgi:NAD(P)-dependent dehydrogenase (short-subunit alcohol dehydrogenase family)